MQPNSVKRCHTTVYCKFFGSVKTCREKTFASAAEDVTQKSIISSALVFVFCSLRKVSFSLVFFGT